MSPSVGNFVHDLVEMAKAMEELPGVRNELERTQAELNSAAATIAAREETILRLKADIERLNEAVRTAEVSRDDAELRFLEADEVADRVHRKVADAEAMLRSMAADLEGLRPKMPEPEPTAEELGKAYSYSIYGQGQSEATPPAPSAPTSDGQSDAPSVPAPAEVATTTGQAEDGVDTDPSGLSASQWGISADPGPAIGEPEYYPPQTGPYSGKLYIRVHGWISRSDWLAGGGTAETYDWREGQPLPEGVTDPSASAAA